MHHVLNVLRCNYNMVQQPLFGACCDGAPSCESVLTGPFDDDDDDGNGGA
jgi:hypothetical protein